MAVPKSSIVIDPTTDEEDESEKKAASEKKDTESPPSEKNDDEKSVVKEINPYEIRWFYMQPKKESTWSSSAWTAFRGRDSLLIELKWRLVNKKSLGDNFPSKNEALKLCETALTVLDGYYEVVFSGGHPKLMPIYWPGEAVKIKRGSWFFEEDWRPIRPDTADKIEEQHLELFLGKTSDSSTVETKGTKGIKPTSIHKLQLDYCIINWYSANHVEMNITKRDRSWSLYLGIKSNIFKLRRGYNVEASFSDGPLPVNHLVLVVHGTGYKGNASSIITTTERVRDTANKILQESYRDMKYRPMFLPVEWRAGLKLDEDIVDAITLAKIQLLRDFLESTFMDIMYYSSPKYRSEVTDGMVNVLNKIYDLFMWYNPTFDDINGTISVVAHSLGSVICYDVVTGWTPLQQYEDFVTQRLNRVIESPLVSAEAKEHLKVLENSRNQLQVQEGGFLNLLSTADVTTMQLDFQVQHFFCLGSPLGLFLALRGQVGPKAFSKKSPVVYNVFHPSDPIAYRLEPLVHPLYSKYMPLRIYRFDDKDLTPYVEMPLELIKLEAKLSKDEKNPAVAKKSWNFEELLSKLTGDSKHDSTKEGKRESKANSPSSDSNSDTDPLSQIPVENRLLYRMDYALKESGLDYALFAAVTSHHCYWTHRDVTKFVLNQIYGRK